MISAPRKTYILPCFNFILGRCLSGRNPLAGAIVMHGTRPRKGAYLLIVNFFRSEYVIQRQEEGCTAMNKFAALILCAASLSAGAAGIDGKWVSETKVGNADGKTSDLKSTFTLKTDGNLLTGTVVQVSDASWMKGMTGRTLEISDGKIDGDKYIFKVKLETKKGDKTAIYEGTVTGDELKGTIKYRGIGITQPFEAKRAD
jgi:hypothetical protein